MNKIKYWKLKMKKKKIKIIKTNVKDVKLIK